MAEGYVRPPRGSKWQSARPTGCGRQRDQGSFRYLPLCLHCLAPAAASGTGHCLALTPPNAVPWVRSEMDTFLSIQLLVSAGKRDGSN